MTTFVITNLDRPGYFWSNGNGDARSARWVSETDGSYKAYSSEAAAMKAFVRICKIYRADIVKNPAEKA